MLGASFLKPDGRINLDVLRRRQTALDIKTVNLPITNFWQNKFAGKALNSRTKDESLWLILSSEPGEFYL